MNDEPERRPRDYRAWDAGKAQMTAAGWLMHPRRINTDIRGSLKALRARSRQQAQNNDHVKYFLTLAKTNIVGPNGFRFQSKALMARGKPDEPLRKRVEEEWAAFGKRGVCEVTGRLSWRDVQNQVVETAARDGEAIVRRVPWANRWGFALQLIDPERLDIEYNDSGKPGGNYVIMGVEMDQWDRAVAYHLLDEPTNVYASQHSRKRTSVPADEIYHIYLPEWVAQSRGIPWTATSLDRLYHVGRYEGAEVRAAQLGAERVGNYRKSLEASGPGGTVADEEEDQFVQNVNKTEFGIIPPGWEFEAFQTGHPNQVYPDFVKAALRGAASGLGVSYNALANDLEGVNYSSLRQGALTERDLWMMLQEWIKEWFLTLVYNDWMMGSVIMGLFPGARESELYRIAWQGRRWKWVDPVKEVGAYAKAVKMRFRSVSSIIREQGEDPDEVWAEIAADEARMESLGLMAKPVEPTESDDANNDRILVSYLEAIRSKQQDVPINVTNNIPAERAGETVVNITNQVETPEVTVTNEVEPAEVRVETPVTVEAPIINVPPADVPDVNVEVTNQVDTPEVTVTNNIPNTDRRVDFSHDRDGNMTAIIEDA